MLNKSVFESVTFRRSGVLLLVIDRELYMLFLKHICKSPPDKRSGARLDAARVTTLQANQGRQAETSHIVKREAIVLQLCFRQAKSTSVTLLSSTYSPDTRRKNKRPTKQILCAGAVVCGAGGGAYYMPNSSHSTIDHASPVGTEDFPPLKQLIANCPSLG